MTGNDSQQERCDIRVTKVNDVYLQVLCEKSIRYELADYFSFYAPGYKFHPKFKAKFWDGKIRLCRIDNGVMYYGLYKEIEKFAAERDYSITFDESFNQDSGFTYDQRELLEAKFQPRDYQIDAASFALKNKRCVLVSPTGSGKSFIIYMIMKHLKKRTLIIVPTISLVHQLTDDFFGYNPKTEKWIHKITAGESKETKRPIVISTWQSIYQQSPEWFDQFEVVVGDECLDPTTKISLPGGIEKEIQNLREGDLVLTFNEELQTIEEKPIVKVHRGLSSNEQMYELKLENSKTIKITGNHKVLLVTGVWKRVDELEIGDCINNIE